MEKEMYNQLLKAAREGINKGFFTKENIKRKYGAAVLSKSGRIFSAGQYSSFNHITNIHAEMAAVLVATMNNEPEITALALLSSENENTIHRICGVCLQFLCEHCQRTGEDMTIIRSDQNGINVRVQLLSELFPEPWIG